MNLLKLAIQTKIAVFFFKDLCAIFNKHMQKKKKIEDLWKEQQGAKRSN